MSIPKDLNNLYVAQKTALEAFTSNPFSPYKKDYIQAQKGLWGYTAWMSSAAYSVIETSRQALSYLSSGMSHVSSAAASTTLGQKIVSIVDLVFPVNVVNGKRHFCFVPKSVEKALGEHIFTRSLQGECTILLNLCPQALGR